MTKNEVEELLQHAEAAGQSRHARPVAAADLVGRVPALARHALAQARRLGRGGGRPRRGPGAVRRR